MGIALEFLKGNGVIPDKRYLLSMLSAGNLGEIAPFRIPLRVTSIGVVPFHGNSLISCIDIMLHQTGGISLFIYKGNVRPETQQRPITASDNFMALLFFN